MKYDSKYNNKYSVKIKDLPNDITEEEIRYNVQDWGYIIRIKVLNYETSSNVYLDFKNYDEAIYFVKAFDKTPFENMLISVELLN
jgi:RNA recognition motif-containing protein